ncbi:MAG TPA: tetratricopeptide repeat protein [Verrucomicrobiae bacterium]|jgi:hypothetical protein
MKFSLTLMVLVSVLVLGVRAADSEQIKKWEAAAAKGDGEALTRLGRAYFDGDGVPKDSFKAFEHYRQAAEKGVAEAQNAMGFFHHYGGGGAKHDDVESLRWYRKAADQGYPGAQFNLGMIYKDGTGVPKDLAESFKWFQLSADQGYAKGQVLLAFAYIDGLGVEKNLVQAHKWLTLAAYQIPSDATPALMKIEAQMKPEQVAEAKKLAAAFTPRKQAAK